MFYTKSVTKLGDLTVCTQLRIFQKEKKIDTQSRADTYIRRKRLISKSDYNLKSGCTRSIRETEKNPKNPLFWEKKNKKTQKKPKKPKKNHWAGF